MMEPHTETVGYELSGVRVIYDPENPHAYIAMKVE